MVSPTSNALLNNAPPRLDEPPGGLVLRHSASPLTLIDGLVWRNSLAHWWEIARFFISDFKTTRWLKQVRKVEQKTNYLVFSEVTGSSELLKSLNTWHQRNFWCIDDWVPRWATNNRLTSDKISGWPLFYSKGWLNRILPDQEETSQGHFSWTSQFCHRLCI